MSYFSHHRHRQLRPFKVRLLTALRLGHLTADQLALMLNTSRRVIATTISQARKYGDIYTASFEIVGTHNKQYIAHYGLTDQGKRSAQEMMR